MSYKITLYWRTDAKGDDKHKPQNRRDQPAPKPGYWALRRRERDDRGTWRSKGSLKVTPELASLLGYHDCPDEISEAEARRVWTLYEVGQFGSRGAPEPLTVKEAFERHCLYLEETVRPKTVQKCRAFLLVGPNGCAIAPASEILGAHRQVASIRPVDVLRVRSAAAEAYKNGHSRGHALNATKGAFSWLHENCLIPENPAAGIAGFKKSDPTPRPIPHSFLVAVLKAAGEFDKAFRLALLALYFTGMRPVQLGRLRWDDIDFDSGLIFAPSAKNLPRHWTVIPDWLKAELLAVERESEFVILRRNGRPAGESCAKWLERLLETFRERHDDLQRHPSRGSKSRPDWTVYDLRDTFATTLLQAGCRIEDVTAVLGDKSVTTVQKHYAEFNPAPRLLDPKRRPLRGIEDAAGILQDALRDAGYVDPYADEGLRLVAGGKA